MDAAGLWPVLSGVDEWWSLCGTGPTDQWIREGTVRRRIIMNALISRMKAFLRSEDGPTATEYAVLLALIIVVAVTAISLVGTKASAAFNNVAGHM